MREIQILNGYRGATILLVAVPEEIPLILYNFVGITDFLRTSIYIEQGYFKR